MSKDLWTPLHRDYARPGYRYGLHRTTAQDDQKCRWSVTEPNGWYSHQCTRKPKHDGLWCTLHEPRRMAEKRRAREAKYDAEWEERRKQVYGPRFYEALKKIADGRLNDACEFANMILEEFEEKGR